MNILFVMLRPGYVEPYASVLELLAERGHSIHLAFSAPAKATAELDLAEALAARFEQITFGPAVSRVGEGGWYPIATAVRLCGDCGRYLDPRFDDAPPLRARGADQLHLALASPRVPALARQVGDPAIAMLSRRSSRPLADGITGLARLFERLTPVSARVESFVRRSRAEIVLATPVVAFGSDQVEYLKAARRLGLPTGVCVASWDNLTNKGVLRFQPERVFVWNESQRAEAVELHGVRPESVVATGAPRFDEWFTHRPSRDAAGLRQSAGLDPDRSHLLYLCSSEFVAPAEASFVRRWAQEVRTSKIPELEKIGLLVRPHPLNAGQWVERPLEGIDNAAVWPPAGALVDDSEARDDFYDSIAHSSAVVGANTSALIEACVIGKSVHTVLDPEFADTQRGTLHYQYLRRQNGGFMHEAATLSEHVQQLRAAVRQVADESGTRARFLGPFIRPLGLSRPATPILADAIERLLD